MKRGVNSRASLLFRITLGWVLVGVVGPLGCIPNLFGNELLLVDGRRYVGELASAHEDGRLEFLADLAPLEVRMEEVVIWGRLPDIQSPAIVILADGSLLAVTGIQIAEERAYLRGVHLAEAVLPLDLLAGVVLMPPGDKERKDRLLDRILFADINNDQILLANGDRISGVVLRLDDKICLVEIEGGTAPVPRENVVAITFQPALRAGVTKPITAAQDAVGIGERPDRILVGLLDGSLLCCEKLRTAAQGMEFTLVFGVSLSAKAGSVVLLEPLGGPVVYISDLEPAEYEHRPFLGIKRELGRDRSVLGSRLRKGGRVFPKGLGMQSWTIVKYSLAKKFRRFESLIGLDDLAGERGSVEFVVRLDGREAFRSGIIRGNDPARPVSLDVTGVNELELVVEYADRAHECDFANWFLARVIP
ncbi:MAG: NPCBM/NEW2 domain-containing protein [Thermoguttaceae bacterium]|nr:NPCBM/NEW2 domain-containing protein [Thermoguttaceae bacterium]MDW8077913.1 NPCBM/NEW2 domain-containing protein [Thermoguttaceae bacterium]